MIKKNQRKKNRLMRIIKKAIQKKENPIQNPNQNQNPNIKVLQGNPNQKNPKGIPKAIPHQIL